MPRTVLLVGEAAGPGENVLGVLRRFGLGPVVATPTVDAALQQLMEGRFELVVLPVQELDGARLQTVERALRDGRVTFAIGTAPTPDPELILRAMRAGIHEFLVHPPDAAELAAAVDRLMRRSPTESTRGQLLAVYSSKGGLGSTSVAVNLAFAIARAHTDQRVALADLVVAGGDVRVFLNLAVGYHMGHLVEKLDRADAELLYSLLTPTEGGVWVLPAPDNPELEEELDATTVSALLEQLRPNFAYTVLDCEHHLSERTLAAFDAADRLVLLTQLNVPALRSTQRTIQLCRRLGYSNDKLCVVVTRHQPADVLSIEDAEEVLTADVYFSLPNDYVRSSEALTHGVAMAELFADAELSKAYHRLAAKLTGGRPVKPMTVPTLESASSRLGRLFGRVRRG